LNKEDNKQGFLEDDFDLDSFKNEFYRQKVKTFRRKYAIALKLIKTFIIVLSFAISYLVYSLISWYIGTR